MVNIIDAIKKLIWYVTSYDTLSIDKDFFLQIQQLKREQQELIIVEDYHIYSRDTDLDLPFWFLCHSLKKWPTTQTIYNKSIATSIS